MLSSSRNGHFRAKNSLLANTSAIHCMTHSTLMLCNKKQRIFTGLFLVNQPTVLFSVAAQCSDVSRLSFHFGPASSRLWPTVCNFAHFSHATFVRIYISAHVNQNFGPSKELVKIYYRSIKVHT